MRFLILIGALLLLTADMAVARESLAYRTVLSGVEQGDLRRAIAQQSWLMSLQKRPPPDLLALRRRADDDRGRILSVLRAWGYYAGTVHIAVNGTPRCAISPAAARCASAGFSRGATTVMRAPTRSNRSILRCAMRPPPITTTGTARRLRKMGR